MTNMNSNNNNNSNLSSPSYTSRNLVDTNTETLANSYSYSIDNSYEPAPSNSKFYISSNSPNSSNDSTSSNFSIRNQSQSCHNLSNSNVSNSSIDKTKPPSNKEQKSSGNYFAAKLKGLKKGVEKLVTNHSKKKHDSNHNDIRSISNHSLNSSNSQSTLASNLGASNSSNTNKKYETKNVEERSINGGHTPTTPTYDYSYQHQQSTSSETNAQGHSARSTNISDDEADDSGSLHSVHSYTLKNTNGDSKYVVPFSQSKSLQESSNKNVKIINSRFTQPNDFLDKQDQFELDKKLALITPNDHVWLQKRGFEVLLQQAESKKAEIVSLKADIEELNKYLVGKKEPVRSQFEIETLKGEIRELANEKWKLEMDISKRYNKWECKKCTFKNDCEAVQCSMCLVEKDVNETIICNHCGTKNPLANFHSTCKKCHAYFAAETNNDHSAVSVANQRERRSSSNVSSSSNHSSHNVSSPTTPTSRNLAHNSSVSSSSSLNSAISQTTPINHSNLPSPFSPTTGSQHPSIPFLPGSNSNHSGLGYTPLVQPNQNLPPRSPRMQLNISNNHQNYINNNNNSSTSLQPPNYSRNNT